MSNIPPLISSPATPTAPGVRIELLDVVRGFALFGILLVNITSFIWPVYYLSIGFRAVDGPFDVAADWLVRFFAEGKFYPLFSLLFGTGIAIQFARTETGGTPFKLFHVRRMLMLLLIGMIHAFLVWEGDILMFYAIMGLILLAFRNCRPRTLLIWVAACVALPVLVYLALGTIALLLSWIPQVAAEFETAITDWYESDFRSGERDMEVFARGTFSEIMEQRALNVVYIYTSSIVIMPVVLMSFLAGLYAVKRGIVNNLEGHLPLFRRILFLALLVGVPANVLLVISYELASESWAWWFCALTVHPLAGTALMLAYVSAIVLLHQQERWRRWFGILAPVGRMALTNYLLQSLICTTIFYSYGLGLYGQVGMGVGVLVATLVFLAQIPLSHWWLNRFQFGPAEWFWRSVTYMKLQPMRHSKNLA